MITYRSLCFLQEIDADVDSLLKYVQPVVPLAAAEHLLPFGIAFQAEHLRELKTEST